VHVRPPDDCESTKRHREREQPEQSHGATCYPFRVQEVQ
jgi:hypothetical protein